MNRKITNTEDDDVLWMNRKFSDPLSKPLPLPPATYYDLKSRYEELSNLMMPLEEVQAGLLEEMFRIKDILFAALIESPEYQADMEELKANGPHMIAQHNSFYTKLELNFNLPYMKKTQANKRSYYEAIQAVYSRFITGELNKQLPVEPTARYLKSFVLIAHYFKGKNIRDLDNHYSSFIFNVLRYKKLIEDDSWVNMSFMEKGLLAKAGKTEIYICNDADVINLLKRLKLGQE